MPQTSGVLVVGHPHPERFDFGAEQVASYEDGQAYLRRHSPSVVVFGDGRLEQVEEFCDTLARISPDTLWILSCEALPPSKIIRWNNQGRLFDLIENLEDAELERKVRQALESIGQRRQTRNLVKLFEDQSQQLKRLSSELEARVQKRHRTLRKSLSTLDATKQRLEAFHKALLGIHRASTTLQIEQTLNEALQESFHLIWVKVRFENQSSLARDRGRHVLCLEIPFPDRKLRGEVLLSKAEGQRFTSAEIDFLQELTEALALALLRMQKLEQAETLKAQWQATFDSIPHPLCLTTTDFEILKLNSAFQQCCKPQTFRELIGKKCFRVFFGDDFDAPEELKTPFSFRYARTGERETEHFEVIGQPLGFSLDNRPVQLVLLRSITEDVRYERRIFEASKLAELGTIGSSIAHELNNPLGGMLSFLQLIRMDLQQDDPLMTDIRSMEEATLRCRDIVQNLLSFARKQDLGELIEIRAQEVVDRAVKLMELQSKSQGIAIDILSEVDLKILASPNALSQALCNLLQNSVDAIAEKLKADPLFPGRINVELRETEDRCQLRIVDNGTGIRPEIQSQIFNPLFTTRDPNLYNGMGLTNAFSIITEHGASLEILSQTGSGRRQYFPFRGWI